MMKMATTKRGAGRRLAMKKRSQGDVFEIASAYGKIYEKLQLAEPIDEDLYAKLLAEQNKESAAERAERAKRIAEEEAARLAAEAEDADEDDDSDADDGDEDGDGGSESNGTGADGSQGNVGAMGIDNGTGADNGGERDITDIRAEYKEVFGKNPFPGWKEDELLRRIKEKREGGGE